jgi:hypothetical protein
MFQQCRLQHPTAANTASNAAIPNTNTKSGATNTNATTSSGTNTAA